MLATFIIGLREGLEAALVVGIIAAFLRRNGHGLTAMWLGVGAAALLSLAVGVALASLERALPQAAQEGLEAVIGALAVAFVTGMVFWMNAHARDMKQQLEARAAEALGRRGGLALAAMAFLAVLKEGFETSVFLLATFSVAHSAALAALGAVSGLLVSVLLGWGIFAGGVRLDLGRFFRITSAFLILVAAGLVLSSLRTAHEAGWLDAGQAVALDLSWLVAHGTIRSALLTGVLGIPPDPRVVEVVGWLAYLVPVSLIVYWPRSARPDAARRARIQLGAAGALAVLAAALALAYPRPEPTPPVPLPLVAMEAGAAVRDVGSAELGFEGAPILRLSLDGRPETRLALTEGWRGAEQLDGVEASAFELAERERPAEAPASLALADVMRLAGGRLPRGINPAAQPGPFRADWTLDRRIRAWTADGRLVDLRSEATAVVALSGGGLRTPRTFRVAVPEGLGLPLSWQAEPTARREVVETLRDAARVRTERRFWAGQLPIALVALALLLLAGAGLRTLRPLPVPARPRLAEHS